MRITVSSSRTSHAHRVIRERDGAWWVRRLRKALVPARKMKAGAQKCVTQRVKNTAGSGPPGAMPEYTRTWSMAMSTMTAPRAMSIEVRRWLGMGETVRSERDHVNQVPGQADPGALCNPGPVA